MSKSFVHIVLSVQLYMQIRRAAMIYHPQITRLAMYIPLFHTITFPSFCIYIDFIKDYATVFFVVSEQQRRQLQLFSVFFLYIKSFGIGFIFYGQQLCLAGDARRILVSWTKRNIVDGEGEFRLFERTGR